MGKMGIPGSISVNLSDGRSGMETSGRRMAGSGKQYPASVVGILWGDTGRKNTVAFRGTGRTVADRYFCTVFLEYGNSGGTKRAGRAFVASEILIVLLELMCGCRFLQPGIFLIGGSLLALLAMGQNHGVSNQRILYRSGLWAGGLVLCLSLLAGPAGSMLAKQTNGWNEWLYQKVQKKTSEISRAMESQNGYLAIIIRRRMAV